MVCELIAAAAATAPYSLLDNTISDLGATTCTTIAYPYGDVPVCSPLHPLVNGAFIVFGLLLAIGAVLLRGWLPKGAAATTSVGLWVITGLSSVATGLVPLDQDLDLHSLVALPAFVAQSLALLVIAYVLRHRRGVSGSALVAGAVSLVGLVAFLARTGSAELGGLFERLAFWPGYLWLPVLAVVVLCERRVPCAGRRSV
ncbi:DUF998 domain-containing protein [Nocardioides sp. zg-1228]|uniref:DUF998 domain-containing protein n=1 Tax=Nocardioides sp. zg-1228 TaxID=2763008 RepID=UPI001642F1EC|nr:DUF998 domain-containing protein [Nocardioides sp. zg-1228]QSF59073.1 DUF998 domain-containing protein [Nocardioides sp. zg-1228]